MHLKFDLVSPRKVNEEVCVPYNVNRTHAFALRGDSMRAAYRHLSRLDWWEGNHVDHRLGRFVERRDPDHPDYAPRQWLAGLAVSYDRLVDRPGEEGRRVAEFLGVGGRDLASHVARAVAPIRLYRLGRAGSAPDRSEHARSS